MAGARASSGIVRNERSRRAFRKLREEATRLIKEF
jgi:hypothetical protein